MSNKQKGKYPTAFKVDIIQRFMEDKDLEALNDSYKDVLFKRSSFRKVTRDDLNILRDYKKGMMFGELAEKYGRSVSRIKSSVLVAARE